MTSFTLEELASVTNSKLQGNKKFLISGINTLEDASNIEASFLANPRYIEEMKSSHAGVICVDEKTKLNENQNYLISNDPSRTFQQIAEMFLKSQNQYTGFNDIHSSAVIHETAKIGKNVQIGPNSSIDKNVVIKDSTYIAANVSIGPNVQIGEACTIHPHVTIREGSILHNRVQLQPGVVIGSCGFGYTHTKEGKYIKILQLGIVVLEDDVDIGANTTIDRARFKSTIIKKGTKVDNLVQIAHNVEIGEDTAIAAQTGIAGSSKIGSKVIMGGQVGVTGHIEISDYVMLATRTGVSKNLKSGKYRGSPAIPLAEYNRQYITYKNLDKIIKKLESSISKLKDKA